jgi:hypothetical protein
MSPCSARPSSPCGRVVIVLEYGCSPPLRGVGEAVQDSGSSCTANTRRLGSEDQGRRRPSPGTRLPGLTPAQLPRIACHTRPRSLESWRGCRGENGAGCTGGGVPIARSPWFRTQAQRYARVHRRLLRDRFSGSSLPRTGRPGSAGHRAARCGAADLGPRRVLRARCVRGSRRIRRGRVCIPCGQRLSRSRRPWRIRLPRRRSLRRWIRVVVARDIQYGAVSGPARRGSSGRERIQSLQLLFRTLERPACCANPPGNRNHRRWPSPLRLDRQSRVQHANNWALLHSRTGVRAERF